MTDFADDVARALHRRMRRRRLAILAACAAIVAIAIYFVTCGHGFGLGGTGTGKGSGVAAATADAGPRRCIVRVTASGYVLDGKPAASRDAIVTACQATTGAEVTVTGDARQGDWDDLRAALEAAHVAIVKHD
ncbi:MAG: hypothetical protein ABI591_26710 [Kofleriaceae bacterium]